MRRVLAGLAVIAGLLAFGQGVSVAQGSTTIHNTSVPVGQTIFGPFTVSNSTTATLTIDRTVANGFNALTSSSEMDVKIQTSPDGGTTWQDDVESNQFGGIIIGPKGTEVNTWVLAVSGFPNTRNGIRLVAVVTGPSAIEVAGTVATS